ncbi:MAG: FlgD immunoglobulin-like domain containing protein, partial [Candidatus Krumholzibacteriota bacterium]
PDYAGIILEFLAYRHEDLSADAPGMFYNWSVRSADTDNSAGNGFQDIFEQGWQDRGSGYLGGSGVYSKMGDDVTDLMQAGRDEVQVKLSVFELGWVWYWTGDDGYPAPYYDNVIVKVFPYVGPAMWARELDLAQDNFPARGSIDTGDLGSHSVRFDMANNISLSSHLRNDPGDSMVVDIWPVRAGADFDGSPTLNYILDRNPLFDPYRTAGLPDQGSVAGLPAVGSSGSPTPDKWAFDLPDTGFLFPGDLLHYYISATDAIGGVGGTDPKTAIMPADTTGFSTNFWDPLVYDSSFTVRALPSIREDSPGVFIQPDGLLINDFANRGGENKWYIALAHFGAVSRDAYDLYYVNGPSSGVGNGIGGRANADLLDAYEVILYTSGDLSWNTLGNGDFNNDAGDDVGTLTAWLDQDYKRMFLTGDNLASNLVESGTETLTFLESYMGVGLISDDVRPLIDNQTTPLVAAIAANPVFVPGLSWIAFGGCPGINNFDAVEANAGSLRIAEFLNPAGLTGMYPYSAATLAPAVGLQGTSRVISLPYDLMNIYTDPSGPVHAIPGRAMLLSNILHYFGFANGGDPTGTGDVPNIAFRTSHYPNPFNPSTTIKYSLPKAGHLKLRVYNVRGQLVKTLIDGPRPAGADQAVVWDGSNNLGSSVSSGVYFYEARLESDVKIGKMTLLK